MDSSHNLQENFSQIATFKTQIAELKSQIPFVLDNFKKYYVLHNKSPANNEYSQTFSNVETNMETMNSKIFTIERALEKHIDVLNKKLMILNKKIKFERERNGILKKQYKSVYSKEEGSAGMIDEYREMYNMNYLHNFDMAMGVILAIYITTTMFTMKIMVSTE